MKKLKLRARKRLTSKDFNIEALQLNAIKFVMNHPILGRQFDDIGMIANPRCKSMTIKSR